jgi:hypothetical protein
MAIDLVVLTNDLSRVPVERLRHVGVAMTVVGGEVVYEACSWVPMNPGPERHQPSNTSATDRAASLKKGDAPGQRSPDPHHRDDPALHVPGCLALLFYRPALP